MVAAAIGQIAVQRPLRRRARGGGQRGELDEAEMELVAVETGHHRLGRASHVGGRSRPARGRVEHQLLDRHALGIDVGRSRAGRIEHADRPFGLRIEHVDLVLARADRAQGIDCQLGVVVGVDPGPETALPGLVAVAVVPRDFQPRQLRAARGPAAAAGRASAGGGAWR